MKRIYTISAISVLVVAASIFFACNGEKKFAETSDYLKEEQEEELEEQATAQAYREWLNDVRSNPVTGKVEEADILAAREQLRDYYTRHAGTRGGSLLSLEWENFGPNNVGGRTRSIMIDKDNPSRMYAGGASGGLYYTNNGGLQWFPHPQNDEFTSLLISTIAQASNGDIYFGTGEIWADYYDASLGSYTHGFTGDGMYKASAVTGADVPTFSQLTATIPTPGEIGSGSGATWGYVNRIACSPTNPDMVVAATNTGLKISTDGGTSWSNCTGDGSSLTGSSDDVMFDKDGFLHAITGITSLVHRYYRSESSGDPSAMLEMGDLPSGSIRRVLAVSPSDPNYVYVYSAKSGTFGCQGVFQSTDHGTTFTKITEEASEFFNPNGTGANITWNMCIAVNPVDPQRIYIGGQVESWTWNGASATWVPMSNSGFPTYYEKYIHADHHWIIFHPTDPEIMYFGSDGGISRSLNASATYPNFGTLNKGLNFYQAHGIAIGGEGEAMGGSQDNGTQYVNFDLNSILQSTEVLGGDGGKTEISRVRPEYLFATFFSITANGQGAVLRRSVNSGSSMASIYDCNIDGGLSTCTQDGLADGGTEFVTPFVLWENYDLYATFADVLAGGTVEYPAGSGDFYGSGDVVSYEGRDITLDLSGLSESRLYQAVKSNLWVTPGALFSSTEAPVWFKVLTGSGNVTAIEYDASGDIAYVGTANGKLYRLSGMLSANYEYVDVDGNPETPGIFSTVDAGITTFTYPTTFANDITGISVDRDNPENIAVSVAGFGVDQNVWHSDNALDDSLAVWDCISDGGALANIPVYDVLMHVSDPDKILIATEFGVWSYSLSAGGEWTQETAGLAGSVGPGNVPVFEIREDWVRNTECMAIYIGSHGNGYFRSTTLSTAGCDFAPVSAGPIQEEIIAGLTISPNPADVTTTATITLNESATITTLMYNMYGGLVKSYGTSHFPSGVSTMNLDVRDLNPGSYLVSFEINGVIISRRLVVI